jgi:hypothetical protein
MRERRGMPHLFAAKPHDQPIHRLCPTLLKLSKNGLNPERTEMTRRFDKERAAVLLAYMGDNIGLRFGAAVIKCNLPLAYVAELFSLSRNTIDSWFAGKPVREKYHLTMNKYIDRFNADYEAAKLPCRTLKKARQYIEELKMEIYGRPPEIVEPQAVEEAVTEEQ